MKELISSWAAMSCSALPKEKFSLPKVPLYGFRKPNNKNVVQFLVDMYVLCIVNYSRHTLSIAMQGWQRK